MSSLNRIDKYESEFHETIKMNHALDKMLFHCLKYRADTVSQTSTGVFRPVRKLVSLQHDALAKFVSTNSSTSKKKLYNNDGGNIKIKRENIDACNSFNGGSIMKYFSKVSTLSLNH